MQAAIPAHNSNQSAKLWIKVVVHFMILQNQSFFVLVNPAARNQSCLGRWRLHCCQQTLIFSPNFHILEAILKSQWLQNSFTVFTRSRLGSERWYQPLLSSSCSYHPSSWSTVSSQLQYTSAVLVSTHMLGYVFTKAILESSTTTILVLSVLFSDVAFWWVLHNSKIIFTKDLNTNIIIKESNELSWTKLSIN